MDYELRGRGSRKRSAIFIASSIFIFAAGGSLTLAHVDTNIIADSPPSYNHWTWNDLVQWTDWRGGGLHQHVRVRSDRVDGFAYNSAVGYLQLDCLTPPPGGVSDCVTAGDWRVTKDSSGGLAGWAWSESIGWVSFNCANDHDPDAAGTQSVCSVADYKVAVDQSGGAADGEFTGWAWNAALGWVSFNCSNTDTCGTVDYRVKTDFSGIGVGDSGELISSTFDFSGGEGITLNAIQWKGSKPTGTAVKFQIASSNTDSAPAAFQGPDGTVTTYYEPAGPGVFQEIIGHADVKYVRYKAFLESDSGLTASPRVDEVIINYAP